MPYVLVPTDEATPPLTPHSVTALELSPRSVLVVTIPKDARAVEAMRLKDALAEALPGQRIVIVREGDVSVTVVEPTLLDGEALARHVAERISQKVSTRR
jgi:hypothetical protein